MTKLTVDEIRERKTELEEQFAELLTEFEKQSGFWVRGVTYIPGREWVYNERTALMEIAPESKVIIKAEARL